MKVLVVGMTPLPWKFYRALQNKYTLHVLSVKKPFLKLIARQQYETTIIWSEKLSPIFTKKLLFQLLQDFPSLDILVLGNHLTSLQRAELLSAGAKDCISDSVCIQELLARLHNIDYSKKTATEPADFYYQDFHFDFKKNQATYQKTVIPLNKKEALLLGTLLSKPNCVFSPQALYNAVWNTAKQPSSNSLEVYMCSLRRKINKQLGWDLLVTFKGRGYGAVVKNEEASINDQS